MIIYEYDYQYLPVINDINEHDYWYIVYS